MKGYLFLEDRRGKKYNLPTKGLRIGRMQDNTLIIKDASVSRHHAEMFLIQGRPYIRDLGSKSGTFVNGKAIHDQTRIRPGDVITFGSHHFNLHFTQKLQPGSVKPAANQRIKKSSMPTRSKANVPLIAFSGVMVVGLVIAALFFALGPSNTDNRSVDTGDFQTGSFNDDGSSSGSITSFNGTDIPVAFKDDDGDPVSNVRAEYISDASGVTIIAIADDENYLPALQFFPTQTTSTVGKVLSSPIKPNQNLDITVTLPEIYLDQHTVFESAYLNADHLEKLPQNMPGWGKKMGSCKSVAIAAEAASFTIAVINTPHTIGVSFLVHHAVVIVIRNAVSDFLCEKLAGGESPNDYVAYINSDLGFSLIPPSSTTPTGGFGIVLGQVVDANTQDGIPGSILQLDGDDMAENTYMTHSNGWYQLAATDGQHAVNVSASGYEADSKIIDFPLNEALIADPISLQPEEYFSQLGRGDIWITLSWNTLDDLDLHVIDPDGYEIFFDDRYSPSGGELDVDSNLACEENISNTPVENIFWTGVEPPQGEYQVLVHHFISCESSGAVPFEVLVSAGGQNASYSGAVSPEEETLVTTFRY